MKYLFLVYCLGFLCLTSIAQFSTRVTLSKDVSNSVTQIADMDNDGDQDFVLLSSTKGFLSVEMNDGSGKFTQSQIFYDSFPERSNKILIGDIDNDGWKDVISIVYDNNIKLVLYKNNSGILDQRITIYSFTDFYYGNFCFTKNNNDAYPEIAVNYDGYGTGLVFPNINGVFQNPITIFYDYEIGGRTIKSIDMDNDGDEDLITNREDGSYVVPGDGFPIVSVWFRNDGATYSKQVYQIRYDNGGFSDIDAVDLNADNLPEYIILGDNLIWYDNNNRPFSFPNNYGNATSIFLNPNYDLDLFESLHGDFNNDGFVDFVGTNIDKIMIAKNDMTNHFTVDTILREFNAGGFASNKTFTTVAADLNNDGLLDLMSCNDDDDDVFWLENLGNFQFKRHYIYYNASSPYSITLNDYNDDGMKDVLAIYQRKQGLHAFTKKSNGDFENNIPLSDSLAVYTYSENNFIAFDIDNDHDDDIICTSSTLNQNYFYWYEKNGVNSFTSRHQFPLDFNSKLVAIKDMDNDGLKDIILKDNLIVKIKYNQGGGIFGVATNAFSSSSSYYINELYMEDMNGDGLLDFVFTLSNSSNYVRFVKNLGTRNFSTIFASNISMYATQKINFGDLNSDGLLDIIPSSLSNRWQKNLGDFQFTLNMTFVNLPNYLYYEDGIIYDIDQDGDNDVVAIFEGNNAYDYKADLKWVENLGNETFSLHDIENGFTKLYDLKLDDIDNDGDKDLFFCGENDLIGYYKNEFIAPIRVEGKLFIDTNRDGIKDGNDPAFDYGKVSVSPISDVSFANVEGEYFFTLEQGNYALTTIEVDTNLWLLTTDSTSFNIHINDTTFNGANYDFGFSPKIDSTSMIVDIASQALRCDRIVQQTLNVQNIGGNFPKGLITYEFDSLAVLDSISPLPDSLNGHFAYWHFDSLFFFEEFQIKAFLKMPDFNFMGTRLIFNLTATTSDSTNNPNYTFNDAFSSILTCAYDPNNKLAENIGYTDEGFILKDEKHIDYTINFQNTGTDTATTIFIRDNLNMNLDFNSLEILSASHPMNTIMDANGQIKFLFENINLPDSNVNEYASKGYVKYRINLDENLSPGTVISNYGAIYFDENPPIVTNTTKHTIFDCNWMKGISILPSSLCTNDSTSILSTGNFIDLYEWSYNNSLISVDTIFKHQFIAEGFYDVSLKVSNPLCIIDTLIQIDVRQTPLAFITSNSDTLICQNNSLVFNSLYSNSTWIINNQIISTDSILTSNQAGLYVLKVENGNCISTDTLNVQVQNLPNYSIFSSTNTFQICDFEPITLYSDSVFNYAKRWFFNGAVVDSSNSINVSDSGVYILELNAGVCGIYFDTVNLSNYITRNANINLDSLSLICEGDSLKIYSIFDGQNIWKKGNNFLSNSDSIYIKEPGWYHLEYSDQGCPISIDSVYLPVEQGRNASIISNGSWFCQGDSISIQTIYTDSVYWYKNNILLNTGSNLFCTDSGWYSLVVENIVCQDSKDSIFLNYEVPQANQIYANKLIFCPDDNVSLWKENGNINSYWSYENVNISQDDTVFVSLPGWYYLTIDYLVCQDFVDSIELSTYNLPSTDVLQYANQNLNFTDTNFVSITWYLNGEELLGEAMSVLSNPVDGNYSVQVLFLNGCSSVYNYVLNRAGINYHAKSNIIWYPNPANDIIFFERNNGGSKITKVKIYNSLGSEIQFLNLAVDDELNSVSLAHLSSGIYFIELYSNQEIVGGRLKLTKN